MYRAIRKQSMSYKYSIFKIKSIVFLNDDNIVSSQRNKSFTYPLNPNWRPVLSKSCGLLPDSLS